MHEEAKQPLTVTVGDQSFRVRVTAGERERFERIAQAADRALQDVLAGGVVGGPRAFAMALFQACAELDDARQALADLRQNRERLSELIQRIDGAMREDT